MSEKLDRFVEALVEIELDIERLQRDPNDLGWLPATLREQVESDSDCALELAEYIELELELSAIEEPTDAFFTRAVIDRLPELESVDDRRRNWILASAYALAIGVAYLLLGPLLSSGELVSWFDPIHSWYESHALEASGLWMAVVSLVIAGVLVVLPTNARRAGI